MKYRECYSRLLYLANEEKSTAVIGNDSFDDSADVYERIFLSCSSEVFILARGIRSEIFDHLRVKEAVTYFINKSNTKLKFILRAKNEEDVAKAVESGFIKYVRQSLGGEKGKVEFIFYKGDDDWLGEVGSTTIGDNRIYRNRYYQKEYRLTSNASVCFNDEAWCKDQKNKIESALLGKEVLKTYCY